MKRGIKFHESVISIILFLEKKKFKVQVGLEIPVTVSIEHDSTSKNVSVSGGYKKRVE